MENNINSEVAKNLKDKKKIVEKVVEIRQKFISNPNELKTKPVKPQ